MVRADNNVTQKCLVRSSYTYVFDASAQITSHLAGTCTDASSRAARLFMLQSLDLIQLQLGVGVHATCQRPLGSRLVSHDGEFFFPFSRRLITKKMMSPFNSHSLLLVWLPCDQLKDWIMNKV